MIRSGSVRVSDRQSTGVVSGVQPAVVLVQPLWEPTGEQCQLGDQPVELGRPGEGSGVAGAVVELLNGLGGLLGQFQGGRVRCSGCGHFPGAGGRC